MRGKVGRCGSTVQKAYSCVGETMDILSEADSDVISDIAMTMNWVPGTRGILCYQ